MTSENRTTLRFVDRELRRIELTMGDVILRYPLNAIPDSLWNRLIDLVQRTHSDDISYLYRGTVTKPILTTLNSTRAPFPMNCAIKIVRPTLTDDAIENCIDDLEGQLLSLQGLPFKDTIEERIDIYLKLFLDEKKIDRFKLGAAEMYGTSTYHNIKQDPRVSLGFQWYDESENRHYGFQLNAITEIVEPNKPYYRFMHVMRQLFSSKYLELQRPNYVCAYKFWISEVLPKHLVSKSGFFPEE